MNAAMERVYVTDYELEAQKLIIAWARWHDSNRVSGGPSSTETIRHRRIVGKPGEDSNPRWHRRRVAKMRKSKSGHVVDLHVPDTADGTDTRVAHRSERDPAGSNIKPDRIERTERIIKALNRRDPELLAVLLWWGLGEDMKRIARRHKQPAERVQFLFEKGVFGFALILELRAIA